MSHGIANPLQNVRWGLEGLDQPVRQVDDTQAILPYRCFEKLLHVAERVVCSVVAGHGGIVSLDLQCKEYSLLNKGRIL